MIGAVRKPTNANRFGVEPAAGLRPRRRGRIIASRSGSAIVAPTPFSTVRREMCFCDRYIVVSVYS
jgi:hypothetical protein